MHSQKSLSRLGTLSDTVEMLLHTLDNRLSSIYRHRYHNMIHPVDDCCHWKFPESLIQRNQRLISMCVVNVTKREKKKKEIIKLKWRFIGFEWKINLKQNTQQFYVLNCIV